MHTTRVGGYYHYVFIHSRQIFLTRELDKHNASLLVNKTCESLFTVDRFVCYCTFIVVCVPGLFLHRCWYHRKFMSVANNRIGGLSPGWESLGEERRDIMGEKCQLERIALAVTEILVWQKFGPGDHNSWKISPTRPLFSQNVASASDNVSDAHTFI